MLADKVQEIPGVSVCTRWGRSAETGVPVSGAKKVGPHLLFIGMDLPSSLKRSRMGGGKPH